MTQKPRNAAQIASQALETLNGLLAIAEETATQQEPTSREIEPSRIYSTTGVPGRYRDAWERPEDHEWSQNFGKICNIVTEGGMACLVGPRGTGKTRLAVEVLREKNPHNAIYATVMGFFLRVRATFGAKGNETEQDIMRELGTARLLILDEVQERGDTSWEDRILTHLLDLRYGKMLPTILIANLTASDFADSVGPSIASRLEETGGICQITGKDHRAK